MIEKKKLIFKFSSMNSGKSLDLLTKNFMLRQKGFNTILMKPSIDTRTSKITSRLGLEEECVLLQKEELPSQFVLLSGQPRPDFLLVDEAQFLTRSQVTNLSELVDDWNIGVICYGLKLNWQGDFFDGSEELMKIADELIQSETYCKTNTGAPALFHIKLSGNNETVEVGFEDRYDTVSRKVWREWYKNKNNS